MLHVFEERCCKTKIWKCGIQSSALIFPSHSVCDIVAVQIMSYGLIFILAEHWHYIVTSSAACWPHSSSSQVWSYRQGPAVSSGRCPPRCCQQISLSEPSSEQTETGGWVVYINTSVFPFHYMMTFLCLYRQINTVTQAATFSLQR